MRIGINNFIELLVRGDFFLIFLLVIALVIVATIIYLIKLQLDEKVYFDDEDDNEEEIFKVNSTDKEMNEDIKPIKQIKQERFNFEEEPKVKDKKYDYIKSYEDEQEEMAIISASELERRIKEMKDNNEYETHEKRIEEYEEEQENKAIISYEELLRRASMNTISYESEENVGGIKIGKVDTNKIETYSETNDKPYYKEEAFLQSLKEFRRAL